MSIGIIFCNEGRIYFFGPNVFFLNVLFLQVFAKYTVSAYPIQMVCMSSKSKDRFSSSFFRDETTQRVVIEANKLADSLQVCLPIYYFNYISSLSENFITVCLDVVGAP